MPQGVVEVAVQQTALVLWWRGAIEDAALLDHALVRGLAGLGLAGLHLQRVLTVWNKEKMMLLSLGLCDEISANRMYRINQHLRARLYIYIYLSKSLSLRRLQRHDVK